MSIFNDYIINDPNDFISPGDGHFPKLQENSDKWINAVPNSGSTIASDLKKKTVSRFETDSSTAIKTSRIFSQQLSSSSSIFSNQDERMSGASSGSLPSEQEKERLDLVKLALSRQTEDYDASGFFNLIKIIQLSDSSKLELLKFCAQAPSQKENIGLIETLPIFKSPHKIFHFFSDKSNGTEALALMTDYVLKNPNEDLKTSFITKLNENETGLLIFAHNPKFFARLASQFSDETLFSSLVDELKETHLPFFCAEEPALVFQNMNRWSENPLDSLEKRIDLAASCLEQNPKVFARYLLNVFTEEEILANSHFFEVKIEQCLSRLSSEDFNYLTKVNLYLHRYKNGLTNDKDCLHWDCLGEFPVGSGLWTFKLKWTFNAGSQARAVKNLERTTVSDNDLIFPATEPTLSALNPQLFSLIPELNRLGFDYQIGPSGVFFSFPDRETLTKNWQMLRLEPKFINLPPLIFAASEGIATTRDFVELLGTHDVVISNNKEFVHDTFNHAFTTVIAILGPYLRSDGNGEPYIQFIDRMRAIGFKTIEKIEEARRTHTSPEETSALNILEESLGMLYDIVTAIPEIEERMTTLNSWESGQFFEIIYGTQTESSATPPGFLAYLWKSERFREDLIQLGVPADSPFEDLSKFVPTSKLQQMWAKIY